MTGFPNSPVVSMLAEHLSFLGDSLQLDLPLGPFCTYRVGGPADLFVSIGNTDQLDAIAAATARLSKTHPEVLGLIHVIGKGSNLLVADSGVRGLVLQLGDYFTDIDVTSRDAGTATVRIGGAAALPVAARRIANLGLTGFEWAVGIPGSVGGAVRMNAGGHGSELASVLTRVHLSDLSNGDAVVMEAADLDLGYRRSNLQSHQVVTAIEITLTEGDSTQSQHELSEIVKWRREHQPGGPNAGSVFTNPPGDSAGRLIDTAGCRGLRLGTAEVSTKHANFIQADPDGNADDVVALMKEIVSRVEDRHGVVLHAETILLGFPEADRVALKRTAPEEMG